METYRVRRCRLAATGMNHSSEAWAVCDDPGDPRAVGSVAIPEGLTLRDVTGFAPPDTLYLRGRRIADSVVLDDGEADA